MVSYGIFWRCEVNLLKPVAALIMFAAIACSPSRPSGVPEDARWAGSAKEGCFLKVGERVVAGWHLEGWDKGGKLVVDGVWELDGIARASIQLKEIVRFDGQTFYLDDGAKITKFKAE
jgi:hypothetical protein